uniref:Transmembrane protein n=1 Tax=Schistosoma mansoni TaxID=6183 RepID=A0A3Q0KIM4_SCHMA
MKFYTVFICVSIINTASAAYEDARCKCVCLLPSSYMNNTKSSKKIYVKAIPSEKCTCEYMLQNDKDLCRYCECKFQVRNTATIKVVVCLILTIITALVLYMLFLSLLEPLLSTRYLSHKTIIDMGICSEPQQPSNFTINQHSNNNDKINDARSTNSWVNINIPVSSSDCGNSAVYSKAIDKAVIWDKTKLNSKQLMDSNLRIITAPSNRGRLRSRSGLISNDQVEDPNGLHLTTIPSTSVGVSSVVNRVRDQQQRWKGNVEAQRTRVFSERSLLN